MPGVWFNQLESGSLPHHQGRGRQEPVVPSHILSPLLRNDDLYMLPNPRIELLKKLPMYSLPYEWNNSGVLKYYANVSIFKYALRETMFEEILMEIEN